ncbi:TPA: DNA-directed RNA polymerase subunit L [Candidatus Bathyarchaeota archaeon]|nr:DNA-directed RNA polymerase subunit L [Candidatus Bathyarchaeota archaeon]
MGEVNVIILKETEKELKIEVDGEGHSLCNLLQQLLLKNENVEIAGYDVPHPLLDRAVVYIRVTGKETPKDALIKALKELKGLTEEFLGEFEQAK